MQLIITHFFWDYQMLIKCVGVLFILNIYFFLLPKIIQYSVSYVKLSAPSRFLIQELCCGFIYTIHSMPWLGKESKTLFFIKILNVYPHINFMYKGLQIVQKLDMPCDTS